MWILILLLMSTPAEAEPVSTAIGLTALISGTLGASVFGFTAGTIGGAIVTTAVAIGTSYLTGKLTQSPTTGAGPVIDSTAGAANINTPADRVITRQSVPAKRVIVGRGYVG